MIPPKSQAFPNDQHWGLTKLEYYATHALAGLLARAGDSPLDILARRAVIAAKALELELKEEEAK